jgi:tetratricopeptide (TPR) repeat protein
MKSIMWRPCRRFALALGLSTGLLDAQARIAAPPPPTLDSLQRAAAVDSLDAATLYRLALRYDLLKRYDDAERLARRAVAVDSRYAPAWLLLGYLPFDRRPKLRDEVDKGRVPAAWRPAVDSADRLMRRAFLVDPLVDFRVIGSSAPPEDMIAIPDYGRATTDYLLYLGVAAFSYQRYELSYSALNTFIDRAFAGRPRDSLPSGLFWYRGLAAAHLRKWDVATADFRTLLERALRQERADSLIQIQLETNDYRYTLAIFAERWGKPADAIGWYQEAIAADLGLYMGHVRLAGLYRSVKMWPEAIAEARLAVTANPDDPGLLVDLGVILREAGKSREAEETLRQAVAAGPQLPAASYQLGITQLDGGKVDEARAALTRFITLAPSTMTVQIADARRRLVTLAEAR